MDAPIYWVLWMPTTTHNILIAKSPFERLVEGNISDNASYEQTVTAQLDDNNNIQLCFSSIIQSGNTMKIVEKSSVIELKYIDSSSNGLFLYECQCVTNDEVTKRLAKTPRHATIHLLKKLYHKHVFHGTSKDNNITDFYFDVYISDSKPDIKEENNGAILHYLQEIEEKFKNAVEYFEIDLIAMRDHKKHIKQIVKRQLFKHYNVLLGETFFYNTLCSSKYLNAIFGSFKSV